MKIDLNPMISKFYQNEQFSGKPQNLKYGDTIKLNIVLKSARRAESKTSQNFTKNAQFKIFVINQCVDKNQ